MDLSINQDRDNNFDLLRLLAAVQVAVWHAYAHLHFSSPAISYIIRSTRYVPGIPVFFAISGFLVFASFDHNRNISSYARNRFLRIYPALWVCLLITVGTLASFRYINSSNIFSGQLWGWIVAQASFFQFYTPSMFRSFGVGNPNGALWTIPVEIGFYVFVPLLFWMARKTKISINVWLIIWIIISIAYNLLYQPYKFSTGRDNVIKLIGVTPGPYLFYFLLGALTANNWQKVRGWYEQKGWYWLLIFCAYSFVFGWWLHKFQPGYWTGFYHFISVILLSQTVIAIAYTGRSLSNKLLRRNDLSYGIYIYHMPVINVLLALGLGGKNYSLAIALGLTILPAWLSWKIIERPALAFKNRNSSG